MEHIKMGKVKCCEYFQDAPDNSTPFLTVSAGALSRALLTPPGVKVGLKDMERFPDMDATEGTTSFCTGGRVVSIWKHKTHKLESTANDNSLQSQQLHTQKNGVHKDQTHISGITKHILSMLDKTEKSLIQRQLHLPQLHLSHKSWAAGQRTWTRARFPFDSTT